MTGLGAELYGIVLHLEQDQPYILYLYSLPNTEI